jgi:hypothetical protein
MNISDMLMVCHHLDASIAEDVAFVESRLRVRRLLPKISRTTWRFQRDIKRFAGNGTSGR